MGYLTPVDIANRALQHLGATRIDATLGFDEPSLNASETAFAYDKLREAELATCVWRFAIKRTILRPIDTDTMLLAPTLWSSLATYFVGSIVVDATGEIWESKIPNNLGNDPGESDAWGQYFGPLSVMTYDATTAYFPGELVYVADGDGNNRVYRSLQGSNTDNPATATAWSATATYLKNQVATVAAVAYMSLIDLNTNNPPATSPLVWTTTFVGGKGSLKWLQIGGPEFPSGVGLTPPYIIYPLGTGPVSQSPTRNIYRLPANFLREAPRDPKAGAASYLGSPTNLQYTDWLLEGDYIVTRDVDPIMYRFVADITNVREMTALFSEYLAARVALETCQRITQSDSKLQAISNIYQHHKAQSKIANGIETGPTEPPLDDWIATRL